MRQKVIFLIKTRNIRFYCQKERGKETALKHAESVKNFNDSLMILMIFTRQILNSYSSFQLISLTICKIINHYAIKITTPKLRIS